MKASAPVDGHLRHIQEAEASRSERALLAGFEANLPPSEREDIHRSGKRGRYAESRGIRR
jgi:hypothetical protein